MGVDLELVSRLVGDGSVLQLRLGRPAGRRMPTYMRRPIFRYFLRKDERRIRMTRRSEKAMEPESKVWGMLN